MSFEIDELDRETLEQVSNDATYLVISQAVIQRKVVPLGQTIESAIADIEHPKLKYVVGDMLLLMRLGRVLGMSVASGVLPVDTAAELRQFVSELFIDAYSA